MSVPDILGRLSYQILNYFYVLPRRGHSPLKAGLNYNTWEGSTVLEWETGWPSSAWTDQVFLSYLISRHLDSNIKMWNIKQNDKFNNFQFSRTGKRRDSGSYEGRIKTVQIWRLGEVSEKKYWICLLWVLNKQVNKHFLLTVSW